jgi:hypothetical protein
MEIVTDGGQRQMEIPTPQGNALFVLFDILLLLLKM